MEVQVNRKGSRSFWRVDSDGDFPCWCSDGYLHILDMEDIGAYVESVNGEHASILRRDGELTCARGIGEAIQRRGFAILLNRHFVGSHHMCSVSSP
jgi:hypothetical protein